MLPTSRPRVQLCPLLPRPHALPSTGHTCCGHTQIIVDRAPAGLWPTVTNRAETRRAGTRPQASEPSPAGVPASGKPLHPAALQVHRYLERENPPCASQTQNSPVITSMEQVRGRECLESPGQMTSRYGVTVAVPPRQGEMSRMAGLPAQL